MIPYGSMLLLFGCLAQLAQGQRYVTCTQCVAGTLRVIDHLFRDNHGNIPPPTDCYLSDNYTLVQCEDACMTITVQSGLSSFFRWEGIAMGCVATFADHAFLVYTPGYGPFLANTTGFMNREKLVLTFSSEDVIGTGAWPTGLLASAWTGPLPLLFVVIIMLIACKCACKKSVDQEVQDPEPSIASNDTEITDVEEPSRKLKRDIRRVLKKRKRRVNRIHRRYSAKVSKKASLPVVKEEDEEDLLETEEDLLETDVPETYENDGFWAKMSILKKIPQIPQSTSACIEMDSESNNYPEDLPPV